MWPVFHRQTTKDVDGFANAFWPPVNKILNVLLKISCVGNICFTPQSFLVFYASRHCRVRFTTRLQARYVFVKNTVDSIAKFMHAFLHEITSRPATFAVSYRYTFLVFTGRAAVLVTLALVRMCVHHPVICPARDIRRDEFQSRSFCNWNWVYCGSINPRK